MHMYVHGMYVCVCVHVHVCVCVCVHACHMCDTIKRHFYACEKFMQIHQNGPLDKFMQFLFMCSSTLCIVMYGAIKIYAVQIYVTND